jgi:hypothetical protein
VAEDMNPTDKRIKQSRQEEIKEHYLIASWSKCWEPQTKGK